MRQSGQVLLHSHGGGQGGSGMGQSGNWISVGLAVLVCTVPFPPSQTQFANIDQHRLAPAT